MKLACSFPLLHVLSVLLCPVPIEGFHGASTLTSGNTGRQGLRKLSLVHPVVADDDDDSTSSNAGSTSSSSATPAGHGVSSTTSSTTSSTSTAASPSSKSSSSSSSTTSSSSPNPAPKATSSNSTTLAKPTNATNGSKQATSNGNATTAVKKPYNATQGKASVAASGENATKAGGNSTNASKSGVSKPPLVDPVVDDVLQFLDDDSVGKNATSLIPPEKDQPPNWPIDVFGIFIVAAIVLLVATAVKNYRKRRSYDEVPNSIVV